MMYLFKTICFLSIIYSSEITSASTYYDTFNIDHDGKLTKINDHMYMGCKELPYKQYECLERKNRSYFSLPHLTACFTKKKHITIQYDNVYFAMELLTTENLSFWKLFIQKERNAARSVTKHDGKHINITDGILAFQESLRLFHQNNSYFIWIAYATRENPRMTYIEQDAGYQNDIEMVCTFFADHSSPLTTHMGIFRTCRYFQPIANPHCSLFLELQGFIAFVSTIIYPQAKYMVTNPTYRMQNILKSKLLIGNNIWIGCAKQRTERHQEIDQNKDDLQLLKTFENCKNALTLEQFTVFKSLDSYFQARAQEEYLIELIRSKAILQYLNSSSVQELNDQLLIGRLTIVPNLHICLSEDFLRNKIKIESEITHIFKSEKSLKRRIGEIVNFHIENFLYIRAQHELEKNQFHLKELQTNKDTQYLPEPLTYLSPLNNYDPNNWIIYSSNGTPFCFHRPEWFPLFYIPYCRQEGHCFLLNDLPTTIISIAALGDIWLAPSKT